MIRDKTKPECWRGIASHFWYCSRRDIAYSLYTNPMGFGISPSEAYKDYVRKLT